MDKEKILEQAVENYAKGFKDSFKGSGLRIVNITSDKCYEGDNLCLDLNIMYPDATVKKIRKAFYLNDDLEVESKDILEV